MESATLVRMANQIAGYFASVSEAAAVEATAKHLREFWDPRMRGALARHLSAGGAGLTPVARAAAERLSPAAAAPPG